MAPKFSEIVQAFERTFGPARDIEVYRAPGRVNLIGEHTDYNLGFVLPVALEMACYVAAQQTGTDRLRVYSEETKDHFETAMAAIPRATPRGGWTDYVIGVVRELAALEIPLSGTDLYIRSDVPLGSGLSSSAAIEVATALALLNGTQIEPLELAQLAQRAESQFVGIPSGIMDQYASVFGRPGAAIQIDCRSLEHKYVELPAGEALVAVNSMVKHELGSSAYRDRVAECRAALAAIREMDDSVQSLRDVSWKYFVDIQEQIPELPRRRARHVISENQRVLEFAAAAAKSNLEEMGRLFVASHRSMQYEYEISCEEIDFLVDTAIRIPGVYGARMTGGGFGGCTVNLVAPEALDEFRVILARAYQERFRRSPVFYDCEPAPGAGRLNVDAG